jgi:hypothetical protein
MTHWHQYAFGHLPNGDRVMLVIVTRDYFQSKCFPAVLICRSDGLFRLWRNGRTPGSQRSGLLAPGLTWSSERDAENALRAHVSKTWGTQHSSMCVLRTIPKRLLRANTPNLARLLIAWYFTSDAMFSERAKRMWSALRSDSVMPVSPLRKSVALTIVPNTDVVIQAVHSGALLARLKLGLERIYISEYVWIHSPKMEVVLRALQARFPERLVLVKAENYHDDSRAAKVKRTRAQEYQFIGEQLQDCYEKELGYDRNYNTQPLEGVLCFRVGEVPQGTQLLWIRQMKLPFGQWEGLDVAGMLEIERQAQERRDAQDKRSMAVLMNSVPLAAPKAD